MNADRDTWTAYATREGLIRQAVEARAPRPSKYGSVRTVAVDGQVFDSRKEAAVYLELRCREKAGEIAELRRQTAWPLHIMELWRSGIDIRISTVGLYRSDFDYLDLLTGEWKVIDVKSAATRVNTAYRLKKKIVERVHGITIDEL